MALECHWTTIPSFKFVRLFLGFKGKDLIDLRNQDNSTCRIGIVSAKPVTQQMRHPMPILITITISFCKLKAETRVNAATAVIVRLQIMSEALAGGALAPQLPSGQKSIMKLQTYSDSLHVDP